MVTLSDPFGFANDLEKIIYGLGVKLIFKINNNDRAIYRVNAGAAAVANDSNIEIRDISWCVPSIDPSNDNRIIVQKGLLKRIILTPVIMREKHFIRMYLMLQISYLICVLTVVLKDLNT